MPRCSKCDKPASGNWSKSACWRDKGLCAKCCYGWERISQGRYTELFNPCERN